MILLKPCIFY
jgi:hypothetical protein